MREAAAIGALVLAGAGAWFALHGQVNAQADSIGRIEYDSKGRDVKLQETRDTVIELRAQQRITRDQLDRIENLLRLYAR